MLRPVAALLLSLAFASTAEAQSGDWQKTWDETVAAAKKEGTVVVLGQPSPAMRNEIIPKFTERYGIKVEHIAGQSSTTVPRIRTERAAGIYSTDVFMSNAGTSITILYAEKMLEPLKPALMLPEVTDGTKWKRGEPAFVDPEKQYLLLLFSSVDSLMVVNTDYVSKEDLSNVNFLINPKFKGKISTEDPAAAGGSGIGSASHFYTQMGPDFTKKLYVDQQPVIQRDRRILSDWLARGNQPICLTCHIDDMRELVNEGFPPDGSLRTPRHPEPHHAGAVALEHGQPRTASERGQGLRQLVGVEGGHGALLPRRPGSDAAHRRGRILPRSPGHSQARGKICRLHGHRVDGARTQGSGKKGPRTAQGALAACVCPC
jgi:hypothetical protein